MELNYEKDTQIDEMALDVEWLNQGDLGQKYNSHYAKCCKELAIAQEEIKTIRSELIKEANKDPQECCNKAKPNAADIEAYYRTHENYKEVVQERIDLEYEKNMAELAKNEINFTRKAALENLVILLGQQYFAGPRAPRDLKHEAKKKREALEKKTLEKTRGMKRKTKNKTKKVKGANHG